MPRAASGRYAAGGMFDRSVTWLAPLLDLADCAAAGGWQEGPPVPDRLALHGRQLNFGTGLREFTDDGFGELDDQVAFTLDYCEPIGSDWVRLEGGLHFVYDEADDETVGGEDVRLKSQILELSVGFNHSFLIGALRPYVGLGAALSFFNLRGLDEERDAVFDDDDATVGGYAKGGLLFQVTRTSHFGFEYRHFTGGDVSLDGTNLDTGYDQFLLVFGMSIDPKKYRLGYTRVPSAVP